jgi:CheY-like chemotaxis protein
MTSVNSVGRVFFCPSCGARYDVARELLGEANVILLCGMCGHAARTHAQALDPAVPAVAALGPGGPGGHAGAGAPDRPPTAAELQLIESQQPRVVVGHEVPAAARSIATVLRNAGFSPLCVKSGELVLSACDPAMPSPPAALVLDVAIPGVLAFEVIEHLRAHPVTKGLPVVLLASVFERTRYKRRPTNLYGADAYLELHHVPDRLAPLIQEVTASRLSPGAPGSSPDARLQAPVERARAAGLRGRPDVVDAEAAQALARRLLSDVALYHGDELADGVRRGDPFASLGGAVDAARDLFRSALSSVGVNETAAGAAAGAGSGASSGASDTTSVFEDELARFGQQLLERGTRLARGAPAPVVSGGPGGSPATTRGAD